MERTENVSIMGLGMVKLESRTPDNRTQSKRDNSKDQWGRQDGVGSRISKKEVKP